jgi:hypothetical protein
LNHATAKAQQHNIQQQSHFNRDTTGPSADPDNSNHFLIRDLDYSDAFDNDDEVGQNFQTNFAENLPNENTKNVPIGRNEITVEDVDKQGKDTKASNEVDEKIPVRTIIIKNTPEELSRFGVKNVPKEFLTHLKEQQRNSKSILGGNTGSHAHNHEHEHNHSHSHEEEERQEKSNDLSNDYDYFEPDSYVSNNGVGSSSVFFDPRGNINNEYTQDGIGSAGGETDQVSANRDALSQDQELPSPGQSNYYTEQDNTL